MASLTSTLTVRLIDAVTAPARAAANSIRGIGTAVQATNDRQMAIAAASRQMAANVGAAASSLSRNVNRMATSVSVPAGFLTFFGAKSVYDFEKFKNTMQAVSGMTGDQADNVKKLALALNSTVPFDASEIMAAAVELGKAGMDYDKIMGTLGGTLNLAAAGGLDLANAAEIAVNVMTSMRLPMKNIDQAQESMTRAADVLSYAANKSTTDVRLMGETFKYVGPIAAASGLSIEDVAAAAMVMANNGIKGAEAGVAMRSALVRMVKPTKPMLAALERLNVNLNDFVKSGRQISAQDIIGSLAPDGIEAGQFAAQIDAALKDPTLKGSVTAMTARLTDIIGGDGSIIDKSVLAQSISDALTAAGSEVDWNGFLTALRQHGATMADIVNIFDARQGSRLQAVLAGDLLGTRADVLKNAPGSTDKTRQIMMQGVVGDWNALRSSLQNLFIAIADSGVMKTASTVFQSMADGLKRLAEVNPELLRFGTYAVLLLGALAPAGLLLGGIAGIFGTIAASARLIAASATGIIGVFRAAAGLGASAAAGSMGSAGAAGAAALATGKSGAGLLAKLWRGAGAVGAGLLVSDILDAADPGGNLWGLTSGIDAWVQRRTGINPSKIDLSGIGANAPLAGAGMGGVEKWRAQQAEIDARLDAIERSAAWQNPGPAKNAHDDLMAKRAALSGQIFSAGGGGEGAATATETMQGFIDALQAQFGVARQIAEREVRALINMLNFSAFPRIVPRIDGSALRGVNADVGVDVP
jgi:hypothetical protein